MLIFIDYFHFFIVINYFSIFQYTIFCETQIIQKEAYFAVDKSMAKIHRILMDFGRR